MIFKWKYKFCFILLPQKLSGPSREVPAKPTIWQKVYLLYQILYPHYIYLHYPWIVRSAFQRENPSKYTWELEIVIPTIIYIFPCGFPQTRTSPSLDPWEVVSLNTYHTYSKCQVRFWWLVEGAWRDQVHGVDLVWRVFCYSCTPTLFSSGSISTWRVTERFFTKFFGFLFNNTSWCYLAFASFFPTL